MPTDLKPSTAPTASALGGTELIPCSQGGASKALTPDQLKTYALQDPVVLPGKVAVLGSAAVNADTRLKATSGALEVRTADDLYFQALKAGSVNSHTYDGNSRIQLNADGLALAMGSGVTLTVSSTAAANGTADTGEARAAAGVWLDTAGLSGLGARLTGRVVEAVTAGSGAPNVLLATESRKLLTNEGATAEAYNSLPVSAPVGTEFIACCVDTDGVRLTAPTGETIRLSASATATGGFVRSIAIGSSVTIVKINATQWLATSIVGTWTVDV